jgi:hypothetical protein
MIDVPKFERWMADETGKLSDPQSGELGTDWHLDEVDPAWEWPEATMGAAVSIFKAVAGMVPPGWDGTLQMQVALGSSEGLLVGEPDVSRMAPDDMLAPLLVLNAPRFYTTILTAPREQYRWWWDEDPWGVTDGSTMASFIASRRHDEWERHGEYRNLVEFKRYCGRSAVAQGPTA